MTFHTRMLLKMKGRVTKRYSGATGVDEGVLGKLGFRDWADTKEMMRVLNGLLTSWAGGVEFRKKSLEIWTGKSVFVAVGHEVAKLGV